MKIIWSPTSLRKIDTIIDFIARDNVNAALALLDKFEEKARSLDNHPLKGRMIPVLKDEMKREMVITKNYLLVYEIHGNTIEILTVRHVKQDSDESEVNDDQ